MNTYSRRILLVVIALSLSMLSAAAATLNLDRTPQVQSGRCASVPVRMIRGGIAEDLTGLTAALARAPEANLTGLIGALGHMIVEGQLRDAAISGRFEPVITVSVAGSEFSLEVCRDSIVGEVSVAQQPRVHFVIGDFDGDGATDVAVRRSGSPDWSVDFGALRRATVGLGVPVRLQLIEAATPGSDILDDGGRCQITWLAQALTDQHKS
jgi:hypothetical protein